MLAMPREVVNIAKTSSLNRVRFVVVRAYGWLITYWIICLLGITYIVTDVGAETSYTKDRDKAIERWNRRAENDD